MSKKPVTSTISSPKLPHPRDAGKMTSPHKMTRLPAAMRSSATESERANAIVILAEEAKSRNPKKQKFAMARPGWKKKSVDIRLLFKSGEQVVQSGVYEISHGRLDVKQAFFNQLGICLRGNQFPPCESCHEPAVFRLQQAVPLVSELEFFKNVEILRPSF
jgi:hypothetical protein